MLMFSAMQNVHLYKITLYTLRQFFKVRQDCLQVTLSIGEPGAVACQVYWQENSETVISTRLGVIDVFSLFELL